jgi:hypothetical protein
MLKRLGFRHGNLRPLGAMVVNRMEFREKFIAFIDILGFNQLVTAAERGGEMPVSKMLDLVQKLGRPGKRQFFEKYGPEVCPAAVFTQRDLDFRATQISDCVVLSAETSPAGGINLISQACSVVAEVLVEGLLCRGYITRGMIYHTDTQFIGTGYQKAVEQEKSVRAVSRHSEDTGTPFVEVESDVCNYLTNANDPCVREMLSRFVKDDGIVTAIFPFQAMSTKVTIDRTFDAVARKKSNHNIRVSLQTMKERMMK